MKGLTLHEPWGSLVAHGLKKIETRSWGTSYRGKIAIHTAKGKMPEYAREACLENPYIFNALRKQMNVPPSIAAEQMPRGVIVAVADLFYCAEIAFCREIPQSIDLELGHKNPENEWAEKSRYFSNDITEQEWCFGDFADGRFAWYLQDVVRLPEPVACKGAQGLWNVPADVLERVNAQNEAVDDAVSS